jgi:hypothetical protein
VIREYDDVTRFEVIDQMTGGRGRCLVRYDTRVELSMQNGGRTLKVFLLDPLEPADPLDAIAGAE